MLTTVLFDLDGTLTNSLPLIRRTYLKVFREMGLEWGQDDVMDLIGLPLKEIGRRFAGADRVQEFFDCYQHYYRQEHDDCMELYPGTRDMLEKLRQQYALGIVTSKSKVGTEMTLNFLKLKDWFSVIITADDINNHKPHPEPVLTALKMLDSKPQNAVYIGDSPFDIVSGNRAGVNTVAVTWGMAEKAELIKHRPDYVVDSQTELLAVIASMQ